MSADTLKKSGFGWDRATAPSSRVQFRDKKYLGGRRHLLEVSIVVDHTVNRNSRLLLEVFSDSRKHPLKCLQYITDPGGLDLELGLPASVLAAETVGENHPYLGFDHSLHQICIYMKHPAPARLRRPARDPWYFHNLSIRPLPAP